MKRGDTNTSEAVTKRHKSTAGHGTDPINPDLLSQTSRESLKQAFSQNEPYPACVMASLCDPDFMTEVKAEILSLHAIHKETDLFRVNQTPDLANIDLNPDAAKSLPNILKLRSALYSNEFRDFVSEITQCGPLSEKTDCAGNVYDRGCHLLTHDDVIGTRRVSYIIYLSDEGWTDADGGALELYPRAPDTNFPLPIPTKRFLPLFNTMGMFEVVPGQSYHAVQEVFSSERRRISIQGWFHAATAPEGSENASLQQVKALSSQLQPDFIPISLEAPETWLEDLRVLGVNSAYLSLKALQQMNQHFANTGSIQLKKFLEPSKASEIISQLQAADERDHVGNGAFHDKLDEAGVSQSWSVVGPPHIRRYLTPTSEAEGDGLAKSLTSLRDSLIHTPVFALLLSALTGFQFTGRRTAVRRFRPGADYTVATSPDSAVILDVTMCFVAEQAADAFEDGEFGGFQCYIGAEDEENPEVVAVYDEKGSGDEVMNISAESNVLSIVLRDPSTMQFVKYLSLNAPSSRCDVFTEFKPDVEVEEPEN